MMYVDDPIMMDCCSMLYRMRIIEPIIIYEEDKLSSQTHQIARQLICILNSERRERKNKSFPFSSMISFGLSRLHFKWE